MEQPRTKSVGAYVAYDEDGGLEPSSIKRRHLNPDDVQIKLMYCGVCHSDIHHVYNEWEDSMYPMVPGHEMTGTVEKIGKNVTQFKIGDRVAVGNLVDSCHHCKSCHQSREQYCLNGGPTWVYNGRERLPGELEPTGELTFGGYSTMIVVKEAFVLALPDNLDMQRATPLLCAGITVYSPLRQKSIGKGHKVGVAGVGGLGHLAIKMAAAMGAEVTAITTSEWKLDDIGRLGATNAILATDIDEMNEWRGEFDLIINTIPYPHQLDPYIDLLAVDGTLWILGVLQPFDNLVGKADRKPETESDENDPPSSGTVFNGKKITNKNRCIAGSNVGGIQETKDMLAFCSLHNIVADIELINVKDIRDAFTRIRSSDVKYRFVIDNSTIP